MRGVQTRRQGFPHNRYHSLAARESGVSGRMRAWSVHPVFPRQLPMAQARWGTGSESIVDIDEERCGEAQWLRMTKETAVPSSWPIADTGRHTDDRAGHQPANHPGQGVLHDRRHNGHSGEKQVVPWAQKAVTALRLPSSYPFPLSGEGPSTPLSSSTSVCLWIGARKVLDSIRRSVRRPGNNRSVSAETPIQPGSAATTEQQESPSLQGGSTLPSMFCPDVFEEIQDIEGDPGSPRPHRVHCL